MAHFAQLDPTPIGNGQYVVIHVSVVYDEKCQDADGNEVIDLGAVWQQHLHGANTLWKQTSYNANFRRKFAGIGDIYDEATDSFYSPAEAEEMEIIQWQE